MFMKKLFSTVYTKWYVRNMWLYDNENIFVISGQMQFKDSYLEICLNWIKKEKLNKTKWKWRKIEMHAQWNVWNKRFKTSFKLNAMLIEKQANN